jgi:hypothetical protein
LLTNKIHIVSFDVPYPADYGGAIDVFYKVKALAEAGLEIYLHCFQYGRQDAEILKTYCKEVWYYSRNTGLQGISLTLPYIVYSRRNKTLLQRLQEIDAPILFEGAHTTYYLPHPSIANRLKIVRNQNVEHHYYKELVNREPSFLKKIFFQLEASKLKHYELNMHKADMFFSVSKADNDFFTKTYPNIPNHYIASFHPYNTVASLPGTGTFCLYHGNLAHPENVEAALYLIEHVFPLTNIPVVIAGRQPTEEIITACKKLQNCTLVANPAAEEMERLIADAHIHILPTFQPTGLKLKLLYALFKGRHVIVNKQMLFGNGLNKCCAIANTPPEMAEQIRQLQNLPFTAADIENRVAILSEHYNNNVNAQRIVKLLQR